MIQGLDKWSSHENRPLNGISVLKDSKPDTVVHACDLKCVYVCVWGGWGMLGKKIAGICMPP